ncbi:DUF1080 domain-containing protein [Aquirufa ecclesiirivi]|uniref:3-keto-disaccharide hydrolase n=1 Tax=Aquirufa ecclesiirivi TaxID=2715124 RepID=UPI0022A8C4FD|nr:DUF1080 domain-containing protein [Aquirufa ecclesiirivi]MCZ2472750.1 DUF1080 domain-containing protein [Aquirufa ecclesiirivi]
MKKYTTSILNLLLLAALSQGTVLAQKQSAPISVKTGTNEADRAARVQANLKIIQESSDVNKQAIAMLALQPIARGESISVIIPFLQKNHLAGPAARLLVKLAPYGQEQVGKAVLGAMQNGNAAYQKDMIQALTDMNYKAAGTAIEALYPSSDQRTNQLILKAIATLGSPNASKILKEQAAKANGAYEPTQALESYLAFIKSSKDVNGLNSLNVTSWPAGSQIKVSEVLLSKSKTPVAYLLGAFAKTSNNEVEAYLVKHLMKYAKASDASQVAAAFSKWSDAKKTSFVQAAGNAKVAWALPQVTVAETSKNTGLRTAASIARLRIQGNAGLAKVWATASNGDVDGIAVGEVASNLAANNFFEKNVASYSQLSASQQTILLIYASYRQWPAIKSHVWNAVQSNEATRAAAYQVLFRWVSPADFDIIAQKLSNASSESEVKHLQSCVTQIQKMDPSVASKVNGYAVKAKNQLNWIPFVSEAESLSWLGDLVKKSKNLEAIKAYVKSNGKATQNVTQQILRYRNALDLTQDMDTRALVFRGLGRCPSLSAMRTLQIGLQEANARSVAADGLATLFVGNPALQSQMTKAWVLEAMPFVSSVDLRASAQKAIDALGNKQGFYSMFNGKDLSGWKGLVENPVKRRAMSADSLAIKQVKADENMRNGWYAKDDELHFTGHGDNLCSVKDYQDFEMYVDWKIEKDGDAGIYLRGAPQVQIWDISRVNVGANVGSGGLYNNQINAKNPLKLADNPVEEWNTFYIKMVGERVTVYLNGELVVDNTILENYWDRKIPIFVKDAIELQAHGNHIVYRNIYVKELESQPLQTLSEEEKAQGFELLFDGSSLFKWTGNTTDYVPENGNLVIYPKRGGKGNLFTKNEYANFHFKFDFQLTPGANNGLGIRAPLTGDAAYVGMELQILDNTAPVYANLQAYQYHGSVYGIIPAKKGFLKPVGEWNQQEVIAEGNRIKVILNGEVILDGDIAEATKGGTPDHKEHPGLFNPKGHIGFLGHGNELKFRNIRVKELVPVETKSKKRK